MGRSEEKEDKQMPNNCCKREVGALNRFWVWVHLCVGGNAWIGGTDVVR